MTTRPATSTHRDVRIARRRALLGASVGNFVEWFDYSTYGYLAATIGQVFFAFESSAAALAASFATFGVAFVARPLGGLFFGSLGDRLGRRQTLAAVILLISASTTLIGLLPGYATVGVAAPVGLVVLRLLQGFSAGGEFGGASTYLVEQTEPRRRGFMVSWLQVSTLGGLLLGSLTALTITSALTPAELLAWGWRIPFLVAAPLGLVGLYIRLRLTETPVFTRLVETGQTSAKPLRETLRSNRRSLLTVGLLVVVHNSGNYLVYTYFLTYLHEQMKLTQSAATMATAVTLVVGMVAIPTFGHCSDRFGRKPVLIAATVGMILFSYPLFLLTGQGTGWAVLAQVVLGVFVAMYIGVSITLYAELFPARLRYGGFSMAYNVSTALFGGAAPFYAVLLITVTGSRLAPALYLIGAAVVSLAALFTVREPARDAS